MSWKQGRKNDPTQVEGRIANIYRINLSHINLIKNVIWQSKINWTIYLQCLLCISYKYLIL
jgi:hypothetical protein